MRRLVLALVLAGCSSHPPKTNGHGHGSAAPDAGAAAPATSDGGATSLTTGQCDDMLDHVLAVMLAELKATKPEDEWPTDDQVVVLRDELAADFMDECLQYPRPVHDCMMAAKASPEFAACAAEPAP